VANEGADIARAVAVDLGATSGRIALGELQEGRISFEIVEQMPHEPVSRNGRLQWDFRKIFGLCKRAVALAKERGALTVGIDAWGVDHGFLSPDGGISALVCYRDTSHLKEFVKLAPHRRRLYELTGIQHQPFNTICQLAARKAENSEIVKAQWMILPDLLGYLLGDEAHCDLTEASTTQLMGLDGTWCAEAFDLIGWPVPSLQPSLPGDLGREVARGVRVARVGSHDTASAVAGFGALEPDEIFLNVGTWILGGCLLDAPLATVQAEDLGFSNERAADGRVRFLKNIPGFYFINRLHEELGVSVPVPEWLASAEAFDEPVDLFNEAFFNPPSMVGICRELCGSLPSSDASWAGFALASVWEAICKARAELEGLTGRKFGAWRVGGGGSMSKAFCRGLANRSKLVVRAGPAEATVMGNLGTQFLAQGELADWDAAYAAIKRSADVRTCNPD
jgi:rhamnulokinase